MGCRKLDRAANAAVRHVIKESSLQIVGCKLALGEVHKVEDRQADQRQQSDGNDENCQRPTVNEVAVESAFILCSFLAFLGKNGSGGKKGESGADEPSFGDTELRGFGHGFLFEDGLMK